MPSMASSFLFCNAQKWLWPPRTRATIHCRILTARAARETSGKRRVEQRDYGQVVLTHQILQIVADGRPGGGTTAVLGLCDDLKQSGHSLALITDSRSYAAEAARNMGIDVIELPFFESRLDPRIAWKIGEAIRTRRPALVHAHGARAGLPLSFFPQRGERRVYTVHGYHFIGKKGVAHRFARMAEMRIASRSNCGIFVSQADRDIARENAIAFADEAVIYNGIALDDIAPAPSRVSFDVVFSARLHRQKNPLFAIEIMRILAAQGKRMLLIGGGELEDEVRRAAAAAGLGEAVTFTGALPRTEALAAIRTARLFLMPSLWEGLPIAPIEALASGVPVIGSDIPGTREVVTHGRTGLLVADFDAQTWAMSISDLLSAPERIRAMAAAGQADVHERFTRIRVSTAHMDLYAQVIAGNASSI